MKEVVERYKGLAEEEAARKFKQKEDIKKEADSRMRAAEDYLRSANKRMMEVDQESEDILSNMEADKSNELLKLQTEGAIRRDPFKRQKMGFEMQKTLIGLGHGRNVLDTTLMEKQTPLQGSNALKALTEFSPNQQHGFHQQLLLQTVSPRESIGSGAKSSGAVLNPARPPVEWVRTNEVSEEDKPPMPKRDEKVKLNVDSSSKGSIWNAGCMPISYTDIRANTGSGSASTAKIPTRYSNASSAARDSPRSESDRGQDDRRIGETAQDKEETRRRNDELARKQEQHRQDTKAKDAAKDKDILEKIQEEREQRRRNEEERRAKVYSKMPAGDREANERAQRAKDLDEEIERAKDRAERKGSATNRSTSMPNGSQSAQGPQRSMSQGMGSRYGTGYPSSSAAGNSRDTSTRNAQPAATINLRVDTHEGHRPNFIIKGDFKCAGNTMICAQRKESRLANRRMSQDGAIYQTIGNDWKNGWGVYTTGWPLGWSRNQKTEWILDHINGHVRNMVHLKNPNGSPQGSIWVEMWTVDTAQEFMRDHHRTRLCKDRWDHTTLFIDPLDRFFQITPCVDHVNRHIAEEELDQLRENENNTTTNGPITNVPKEDQSRLLGNTRDFTNPWQSISVREATSVEDGGKGFKPPMTDLVMQYYPNDYLMNMIFKDSRGQ